MRSLVTLLLICIAFFSFKEKGSKMLTGHWTNEKDLYDMSLNDTLNFIKTKYTDTLYQWGGALCGIGLDNNNSFSEYHNVPCSSESSPLRYDEEKWSVNNNIISVRGPEREMEWKIIRLSKKELTVLVTKINTKNEH